MPRRQPSRLTDRPIGVRWKTQRRQHPLAKPKKKVFSVTKAVKANARERLGSPPAERVLPDPKAKAAAKPKHTETLADLLSGDKDGLQ